MRGVTRYILNAGRPMKAAGSRRQRRLPTYRLYGYDFRVMAKVVQRFAPELFR